MTPAAGYCIYRTNPLCTIFCPCPSHSCHAPMHELGDENNEEHPRVLFMFSFSLDERPFPPPFSLALAFFVAFVIVPSSSPSSFSALLSAGSVWLTPRSQRGRLVWHFGEKSHAPERSAKEIKHPDIITATFRLFHWRFLPPNFRFAAPLSLHTQKASPLSYNSFVPPDTAKINPKLAFCMRLFIFSQEIVQRTKLDLYR